MGIALVWAVAFAVMFSDAGVPFPAWFGMTAALLAIALAWIVRLIIAFASQTPNRKLIRPQLRYWISIPAILVGAVALGGSPMLLSARVYLSANALTRTAPTRARENRWIGLFQVREFSQFDKELRFLTNECGLLDTCGIVFSPDGPPPNRGEDSFTHLYGPWWHWYQSW